MAYKILFLPEAKYIAQTGGTMSQEEKMRCIDGHILPTKQITTKRETAKLVSNILSKGWWILLADVSHFISLADEDEEQYYIQGRPRNSVSTYVYYRRYDKSMFQIVKVE